MLLLQRDMRESHTASRETMAAYRWAVLRGVRTQWFEATQMLNGELALSPSDLVVGSVQCVSAAMQQLGVEVPEPDYYPESLRRYLHRKVAKTTVADVRSRLAAGETLFVKSHAWKLLTGCVLTPSERDKLNGLRETEALWVSEPVTFVAEYRLYVLHDQVRAVCQYGESEDTALDVPQYEQLTDGVSCLNQTHPRAAYVIDWGMLPDGRMALVEAGDAWSIGCYPGIPADTYTACLWARWRELMSTRSFVEGNALAARPPIGDSHRADE